MAQFRPALYKTQHTARHRSCQLAARHCLTPTQLALGFVRSRWFVASTIIGASSLEQLKEALPATQTPISDELLAEIDAIHLRYTNPAP